jgi:predicted permease
VSALRRWLSRLVGSFAQGRSDRELRQELEAHLQLEIDDLVSRGVPEAEARRRALIRSGGVDVAREVYRNQRGFPFIDHALRDLTYALRMIRRAPGFTAIGVTSLALAIAANTAVFSLADAVFFRPLPVEEPDDLVLLEWTGPESTDFNSYNGSIRRSDVAGEVIGTSFPLPWFEGIRSTTQSLSGVFAFTAIEQINVVDADGAGIAHGELVTGDYYATLGVRAIRGRTLTPDDDRAGAEPVAVLSHAYWQRRFASDSSVVGRVVRLNGMPTTIIGVTPPAFVGTLEVGEQADVTLAMSLAPLFSPGILPSDLSDPQNWWVQMMGRLGPGRTTEVAEAELAAVYRGATAGSTEPPDARLRPRLISGARGPNDERRDYRLAVGLIAGLSMLVLLMACTNVASLLLSRASAREGEITMRLALGAEHSRVLGQLLTEALVLALLAEAFGLAFAYWGKDLLLAIQPSAAGLDFQIDARALGMATALAVGTAVLFGLAPALHATRKNLSDGLKSSPGRGDRAGRGRLRGALMVFQVAVSVVLLFGSSLFVGTIRNLRAVDAGFDQERLLVFRIDPRLSQFGDEKVPALYRELQRAYGEIPGVTGVTFSRHTLLSGGRRQSTVAISGYAEDEAVQSLVNPVGPGFFETLGMPILAGQSIVVDHDERSAPVAVVNEAFVRMRLGGSNPLGRLIEISGTQREIIGVAADAKYYSVREPAEATVYLPFLQVERGQAGFMMRTADDPMTIVGAVREVTRNIEPTLSIFEIATQRDAAAATLGAERVLATMTTAFAALALFLAGIGVYGLVSHATSKRTAEIGLRMAMGARGGSILWLVARPTVAIVCLGITLGLGASAITGRYFTSLLFGFSAVDPRAVLVSVAVIAVAAVTAAYAPAFRASRISALEALRHE